MRAVLLFTLGHWARHRALAWGTALAMVLATLLDVALPVFVGRLVEAVSHGPQDPAAVRAAMRAIAGIAALGIGAVALRQLALVWVVRLTLRAMRSITAEAFARVQRFSTRWHAEHLSGSVVRLVQRGAGAFDTLTDTILFAIVPAIVVLLGAAAMLGARWPAMGLAVATGAALTIGVAVALATRWVAPAAIRSNAMDSAVSGAIADALACNAAVKGFAAEAREERRLDRVLQRWTLRTRRTWGRGIASYSIQSASQLFLQFLIAGTITFLWWRGQANAGDVAAVLATFFVLDGYLNSMGQHVRAFQRSVNEMEELVALAAEPIDLTDAPGAPALAVTSGAIEFRNVTFGHRESGPLFRGLSVSIRGGEHVGLVGSSGSGKSTFVRLIQRLADVQGGQVLIDGQDIARVTQESLRRAIAIVPQEPLLFHRSLAENIAYARPGASTAEIARAARLAHADTFIERLPQGYATTVGERGVKLSGGERQRVAIARAFLADAPILILDEATSSLDSESEVAIQDAMTRLLAGRTAIVIAHRLATVRAMDRILVFDRGTIVEEGTHANLLARPGGRYRSLHEHQSGTREENESVVGWV